MKVRIICLVAAALATGITTSVLIAQDGPPPREGRGPGGPPQVPPLFAALDLNKNGDLEAEEIAAASQSLLKLDKNGDGKLTREELRPPRPDGPGDGRGPRPGGQGQNPRPRGE